MSEYPVTLSCNGCKQRFRLTRMEPSVIVGAPKYCPLCGHNVVGVLQDSEQDFWEAMASTYHMKIKLLKLLYEVWTSDPGKYTRFGEYIENAVSRSSE